MNRTNPKPAFVLVKNIDSNTVVLQLGVGASRTVLGHACEGEKFREIARDRIAPMLQALHGYEHLPHVVLKRGKTDRSRVYAKVTTRS